MATMVAKGPGERLIALIPQKPRPRTTLFRTYSDNHINRDLA